MKLNRLGTCGIFFGALIMLTLMEQAVQGQSPGTKSAPVTVTNTTANPVPVTGQVNVGIVGSMPTVDTRQNGEWNVGITGTPIVKIDPNGNSVKVDPVLLFSDYRQLNWTGQGFFQFGYEGLTSKVRVCVKHTAPEPIQVDVFTEISAASGQFDSFRLDAFVMSVPSQSCKIYELTGNGVIVKVSNNGNNTSGQDGFGILAYR